MSDNNELLNGIPTPKSGAAPSTDTGSVNKVQPEEDDTRTRKTVKLSAAGMMPNMGGAAKVRPEDLAVSRPSAPNVPPPVAPPQAATAPRPIGAVPPPMPGAARPAAPSTDTGNIPKQAAEDTRTRKTVRINAATVEDTVKLQRAATSPAPAPAASATPAAPSEPVKPKLTMPSPAKPSVPKPATPAPTPATAEKPAAPAEKPATGGIRPPKGKANLSLKKDEAGPSAPSTVQKGLDELSGRSRSANTPSTLYAVIGVITVLALAATAVLTSQYLNLWSPDWAGGFTILK